MPKHRAHRRRGRRRIAPFDRGNDIEMRGDIGQYRKRVHAMQPEVPEPARRIVELDDLLLDLTILRRGRERPVKVLIHVDQRAEVTVRDDVLEPLKGDSHRGNILGRRPFGGERSTATFDQDPRLEHVLHFAQAEVGDPRSDARLALDDSFQGQPQQRVPDGGNSQLEMFGQELLVDRGARLKLTEDDGVEHPIIRGMAHRSSFGGHADRLQCQFYTSFL